MTKLRLQILTVSTRLQRKGPAVAAWFLAQAQAYDAGFEIEAVDLAEQQLPVFDEPRHPRLKQYEHDHTKRWSEVVERADAFVFVTPEYNHSMPPSLVNALDFLVQEWAYKPVGFVSYGGVSAGTRSVEAAKMLVTSLKMMPMFETVSVPFFTRHLDEATGRFDPGEVHDKAARAMLDELSRWAHALVPLRRAS